MSEAQPGAGWPEAIVVPSWRWRVWLNPGTWLISVAAFVALLLVTAVAVGATYIALALVDDSALSGAAEFAVRAAAVGASVALTWLVILEVMRRAARATASSFVSHIPESDPARAFMLAEIAEHGPPRDSWGAWHVRRWLERVRAGRPARAFVSAHLAERTSRYERTDRPVEPEEVGGGIGRGDAGSIALFGFLGVWVVSAGAPPKILQHLRRAALRGVGVQRAGGEHRAVGWQRAFIGRRLCGREIHDRCG